MIEQQELYCHACGRYVQFSIDTELNGNHTLDCPNCGHSHFRTVRNGVIGDRWAFSGAVHNITGATSTTSSVYDNTPTGGMFIRNSWYNSTSYTGTTTSTY